MELREIEYGECIAGWWHSYAPMNPLCDRGLRRLWELPEPSEIALLWLSAYDRPGKNRVKVLGTPAVCLILLGKREVIRTMLVCWWVNLAVAQLLRNRKAIYIQLEYETK